MFDFILLSRADRDRAEEIAVETRRIHGLGSEDRLHDQAEGAATRKERRILLRAAENVQLHYLQYSM